MLALAPLAAAGLIDDVIVDAKSGVSGAGRGGGDRLHFVTVDENLSPTGPTATATSPRSPRSSPCSAPDGPLTFIPHLVPLDQGELVSCYVRSSREVAAEELRDSSRRATPTSPSSSSSTTRRGCGTSATPTSAASTPTVDRHGRPVVFAAIDNLWKGASGQAIQNLNLMLGLPETEGLL